MAASPAPILVVGDSMLDRYWDGVVDRISPEAPVPVLRLGGEWQRPGGAANVAVNLCALQCAPTLATLIGDDEAGRLLTRLLREAGVELIGVNGPGCTTTQKIRAVCRRQQLLRVDIETTAPAALAQALAERVAPLLPQHRWLLLSDYAKGALGDCCALIERAASAACRVLVDPKGHDFTRYRGAWLLKPNEAEAVAVVGLPQDEADFDRRMAALRQALQIEHLLVTRGERGMVLYSSGKTPHHAAAQAREVYDVSGAGDTALAALAAALARGVTLLDAIGEANRAAAIVIGKFGTAAVTAAELHGNADGARPLLAQAAA